MEIKPKTDETLKGVSSEQALLDLAKEHYDDGLYSAARSSFEALAEGYPLGAYRNFAQLKAADCYFHSGEYLEAAGSYELFLKEHPKNSAAPYATYRAALSHKLASRGLGKDIEPLKTAKDLFERTIRVYPDSTFSHSARHYLGQTNTQLAQNEYRTLQFYKKQGMSEAYKDRLLEFQQKYAQFLPDLSDTGGQQVPSPHIVAADRYTSHQAKSSFAFPPQTNRSLRIERPIRAPLNRNTTID